MANSGGNTIKVQKCNDGPRPGVSVLQNEKSSDLQKAKDRSPLKMSPTLLDTWDGQ